MPAILLIVPMLFMMPLSAPESWRSRKQWGYQQLCLTLIVLILLVLSSRL